ncbi:MAG: ComEC/Rec2 family competence protein [Planctomycetes bacterium]|nr:ComEC/Rec2 family competence protein [Planctomycetota bacterium]
MGSADKPLARPRRPALLAGTAAVAGCAAASLGQVPGWACWLLLAASLPAGIATLVAARRGRHLIAAALTFVAVACTFAAYAGAMQSPPTDNLLASFPDDAELVRVEGVVIEGGDYVRRDPAAFEYPDSPEPQQGFPVGADPRRNVSYLLRVERLPDLDREATGLLKVYAPSGTDLPLNARVSAIGKLRRPRRAGNPGELDSRTRYAREGITHTLTVKMPGQITLLEPPAAWDPRRLAPWVHAQFHRLIGSRMPKERAAVLGATLLGERGNLSAEQRAKFVRSGTVHLLVVSGLHVGLLAAAVLLLLRIFGVPPRWAWCVAGLSALAYLFITGVQPSVLRATIMIVIYALGRMLLRRPDPLNIVGASALVTLAINPADVAELGFQLSYLAVLGILVVAPVLRLRRPLSDSERIERRPWQTGRDWLGASLRISLAVGLCTWPLLAYAVHVVSPSMLVTNLLVGPLLTLMLGVALFTPLAVVPFIAAALAWVLSLLAGLLEVIAGAFAEVPYGHLFLPAPPGWWLAGYYVALASVIIAPRLRLPRILGALAWLAWLCVLPVLSLAAADEPGPARLTALDVGQGQCVVVEIADGPCAVLDCGSTSLGGVGERVLAPYLWQRGRNRIDVLFLSHADADHVNGLPQLFDRFKVGRVYVSEVFADEPGGAAIVAWLEDRCEVRVLRRGDVVALADGLEVRCLWPDAGFVKNVVPDSERHNDAGLVLLLQAGERRVLLPSDVESDGLAGVLPLLDDKPIDVLMAPHHGSHVDGLPSMLQRLQPEHVVLSARESFPAEDSLVIYGKAVPNVWQTWQSGAVTFLIGADGSLRAETYLRPEK